MLIKFFGGAGTGGAIARYLVDPDRAGREGHPPEVLHGDIAQTRELIDSQDRKWTYTTGVLSFALEDRPTEAQQRALMDDFERLAFAGLARDQYDITWVRHSHTEGGRVELHVLTPRMELASGKKPSTSPRQAGSGPMRRSGTPTTLSMDGRGPMTRRARVPMPGCRTAQTDRTPLQRSPNTSRGAS